MFVNKLTPIVSIFGLFILFQNCSPGFEALSDKNLFSSEFPSAGFESEGKSANFTDLSQSSFLDILDFFFKVKDSQPTEGRVFRLSHQQFDNIARNLISSRLSSISSFLSYDDRVDNYLYSSSLTIDDKNFSEYAKWVDSIVGFIKANPKSFIDCPGRDSSCINSAANAFIRGAFRGNVDEEIITSYLTLFNQGLAGEGLSQAKIDLVYVVLNSPYFIYRIELEVSSDKKLQPSAELENLAFTLTDNSPSHFDIDSTEAGTYVDALIASSQAKEKLKQFFIDWLELKDLSSEDLTSTERYVEFNRAYPNFNKDVASASYKEVTSLIDKALAKSNPQLSDIILAKESYLNNSLKQIYGDDQITSGFDTPVTPNLVQRMGLLTAANFFTSHSPAESSGLIERGAFFAKKILCKNFGPPPAFAADFANSISKESLSERQWVEKITANEACVGCHKVINPTGFLLENYNSVGQWRVRDDHNKAIDASIDLEFVNEGSRLSSSPVESIKFIANSHQFKHCFIRQMFRYYSGRREVDSKDAPLLREMYEAFVQDGGTNINLALRALVQNSLFSKRSIK